MSIEACKEIIREAKRIVFFGGAGVSTESGIPDFRGNGGLYGEETYFGERPETILSGTYLRKHPENFYEYYREHMLYPAAKPNDAHRILAKWEKEGRLSAVVTQNIDGLHQMAGSKNVLELHGSVLRNYCTRCGKEFDFTRVAKGEGLPICDVCGDIIRPDVVLYGEGLDMDTFSAAEWMIANADVLLVGGTSLTVYPAASLVHAFRGENFIIVNKSETPYDFYARYVIHDSLSEVLKMWDM